MKNKVRVLLFTAAMGLSGSTLALTVQETACAMYICLNGDGGGGCAPFMSQYKSIVSISTLGVFSCPATISMRLAHLLLCKSADSNAIRDIVLRRGCFV